MIEQGPIILFDAQCVLCSANAQFILKHDRLARYRLAWCCQNKCTGR